MFSNEIISMMNRQHFKKDVNISNIQYICEYYAADKTIIPGKYHLDCCIQINGNYLDRNPEK